MTRAIRIHEYGGPESLRWEKVDVQSLRPGEVRLRHTAIGLNYVEVLQRTGEIPVRLPFIPGNEGAGVVEEIGPEVEGVSVGDRVAYAPVSGSYCEERVISADRLVSLPGNIDDRTAAAMMLQGMTAQYLLRQIHRVAAGDVVLVHAAAGGVGLFLCQWAAALGAVVIGTASTDVKAEVAKANGCLHVINYSDQDVVAEVRRLTDGRMVDVVYDAVGKDTFERSLDSLRPRGHLVSYGNSSGPIPPFDLALLGQKGSISLTRGTLATFTRTREGLLGCAKDLFGIVGSGAVKVHLRQFFPLSNAAEAHRSLEARETIGSSILLP